MTEEEILEGNTLIAEFMGLKRGKDRSIFDGRWANDWFDDGGVINGQRNNVLLFHESWDWLMPVVERIHDLFESEEEDIPPYIYNVEEFLLIRDELCTGRITTSWGVIVDFIKWYNENYK